VGEDYMNNNNSKKTYGWDNLSKFLFFAALFLAFGNYSRFFGVPIMGYAFYRTRSRDFTKRASEQVAFDNLIRSIMDKINSIFRGNVFGNLKNKFGGKFGSKFGNKSGPDRSSATQGKNYVVIMCPKCGQRLRLPANKGNMEAKCPKCQSKIKTRT
jgi:hypothetical protein